MEDSITNHPLSSERNVKLAQMEAAEIIDDLIEFEGHLNDITNRNDFSMFNFLKISLQELLNAKDNYCKIYRDLLCDNNVSNNLLSIKQFKNKLIEFQNALDLFKNSQNETTEKVEMKATNGHFNQQMLPPLALPKFSGNFSEFQSFFDGFNSILNNTSLADAQKFSYLKTCLSGEAANAISGLQATNDNYNVAWQILKDRYDKPKLIIQQHVKNIFEIKTVPKKSAKHLKDFLDTLNKNLLCLRSLQVTDEQLAGAFLAFIVSNKIDNDSREKFKQFHPNENFTISKVMDFLQERVKFLIDIDVDNAVDATSRNNNRPIQKYESSSILVTTNDKPRVTTCSICEGQHPIQYCESFRKLTPELRLQRIQKLNICRNCLAHDASKFCRSSFKCRTCNKPHHSLLHFSKSRSFSETKSNNHDKSDSNTSNDNKQIVVAEVHPEPVLACQAINSKSITLLSTIKVYVKDSAGGMHLVKGILDNGAQQNLVSERLASKLNLKRDNISLQIAGINSAPINITETVNLDLRSVHNSYQLNISCLVISKITSKIPTLPFDISNLKIPSNVKLADEQFNVPGDIDLLIGASHFYYLLCNEQVSLGPSLPILQKTKLGYLVTGNVNVSCSPKINDTSLIHLCFSDDLHQRVSNFFDLDSVQPKDSNSLLSEEEQICEKYFNDTVTKDHTGRFIVSIPLNESIRNLGASFDGAFRRFTSLERRLSKHPTVKKLYSDFMSEYIRLQHMTELSMSSKNSMKYFLPHFEVVRKTALTTKLRVVFDGSFITDKGISLNDCQYLGPVIQDSLFSILLRFRSFQVAVVADCEKMYRQILVDPSQRHYQCILWRENPHDAIRIYQLNTVTYGLKSSSYLATKCIQRLALENYSKFPEAAQQLQFQMYMDDFLGGANSTTDAISLRDTVTSILAQGNIPLRKFLSNDPTVLPDGNTNPSECYTVSLQDGQQAKTLGVNWNPNSDTFHFSFVLDSPPIKITKRTILSTISKFFDPLGLISPLIVRGKILIQQIWKEQLSWDSELSIEYQSMFLSLMQELSSINKISIPRVFISLNSHNVQLHGFADASSLAYGACIFVRSVNSHGIHVSLLCSKSRVAPLKQASTIPKLELCANVLLAQLYSKVIQTLNVKVDQSFLWSDSQIALAWIRSVPNKFKVFVANRIAVIQELTKKEMWNHVSTQHNPADLISRGSTISNLVGNSLWCKGPQYLWEHESNWPIFSDVSVDSTLPEMKGEINLLTITTINDTLGNLINNVSSYFKMLRVLAYAKRFISKIKTKQNVDNYLTTSEINDSLLTLTKFVQASCFQKELDQLRSENTNKMNSTLFSTLNIFLDAQGIIRVGGRIRQSQLQYDTKHPILLPKCHRFTQVLIEHYHKKYLHCGPNQLLSLVRSKFWVLAGRSVCKQVVRKCLNCFKYSPVSCNTQIGNLPPHRLNCYTACFEHTGCDFTGHFLIKSGYTKKASFVKAYICLFICTVTKAVHLELVTSLTSDAFIEAFKRFIARRGKPSHVYSDNGSNFICAANTMKEFYSKFRSQNFKNDIFEYSLSELINWHFIPPRSPHFGGLWESNIRRIKAHLYKVLKDTKLNYESFSTLLCQIESVLNSRPLSPLSNDPNDPQSLTPFHFLTGRGAEVIPEPKQINVPENRLNQFQLRKKLVDHFWRRWCKEVMLEYQQSSKLPNKITKDLKVGDLVLLMDENTPTLQWPLGRVLEVHPGCDSVVRVVTVKLANGKSTKRAVKKVCLLPVEP